MDTNALIIEYSKNPASKYIMKLPSIQYREHNRVCADIVEVFLKIDNQTLIKCSFDGYMSIIATACTAIVCEALTWENIEKVLTYDETYIHEIIWDGISPRRRNASLIGLLAIKNAIHEYQNDGKIEDFSDIMLG